MICCPGCKGIKMGHIDLGPPGAEATAFFTCSRCAGTGVVTPELDRLWLYGAEQRAKRIARRESVRDCAARLGLTLAQLCDLENGRVDFATLPPIKEAS